MSLSEGLTIRKLHQAIPSFIFLPRSHLHMPSVFSPHEHHATFTFTRWGSVPPLVMNEDQSAIHYPFANAIHAPA